MAKADIYENDNSSSSATTLAMGSVQTHSITAGDTDWVRFTVSTAGTYTIQTSGDGDTYMDLYDSSLNQITYDDDSGDVRNARIQRYLAAGTYYARIKGYSSITEVDSYRVAVYAGDVDIYENDDTRFGATTISVGSSQTHKIHAGDDEDWYKFTVWSDGFYSVRTTGGDTILQLYSFEGQAFGYNDDMGNGDLGSAGTVQLYAGTTYYARVTSYGTSTFSYSISLSSGIIEDAYESNGDNYRSGATALSLNSVQVHTMHSSTDVDWVRFTISEAGYYYFFVDTSERDAGQMQFSLYNSSGTQIDLTALSSGLYKGSGSDPYLTANFGTGTYYARLTSVNSGTGAGEYSISLSKVSSIGYVGGDGYEDDGDWANANTLVLGESQTHSLNVYGANGVYNRDVDWFRFVPTATGKYMFAITGTHNPVRIEVFVPGEDGYPSVPWGGGSRINPFAENYMQAGQEYYIRVSAEGVRMNVDSYTISATRTSIYSAERDNYEPDNSRSQAAPIAVGEQQAHSIHAVGDQDWMKFTPTASGYYTFYTGARNGNAGDADMMLGLYDANGTLLIYDDDSFSAWNAMVSYNMTAGQTYYLLAQSARNNAVVPYYTVSVESGIIEDQEDIYMDERSVNDNTRENARTLSLGQAQAHTIHSASDVDWVGFYVSRSGSYTIQTTGSGDTLIHVYDENGGCLASDDDSGVGRNASVTMDLAADTLYYARVSAYGGSLVPLYKLTLTAASGGVGDAYESDDTIATARGIIAGETQSHSIHRAGDVDWVEFRPIQGGTYHVSTSGEADMKLSLYNSAGTLITTDDDSGVGLNARISASFSANNTYYIKAYAYSSSSVVESYGINIALMRDSDLGDEYEDDDSYLTAKPIQLAVSQTHSIHRAGDVDWVTFTPVVSAEYTFQTTGTGANCDTQMYLFSSLTSAMRGTYSVFDDDSGADRNASITATLSAGNTYYVKVKAYSYYTIPSYGLRVTTAAGGASASGNSVNMDEYEWSEQDISTRSKPMANSRVYSHSLHSPTDVDWQMFYTHYDGTYTFQTTGDYSNYWMILYKRNPVTCVLDKVQESYSDGAGGNAAITATLEKENWYYVRVASATHERVPLYGIRVDIDPTTVNGDAYENDNSYDAAKWITANSSQRHSIHVPGDVDWVAFKTGSASGTYTVLADTSQIQIAVMTRNPNGSWNTIGTSAGVGSDTQYSFDAASNTTYYFKISALRGTYAVASYNLYLTYPLDSYERDDISSLASVIPLETEQTHSLHSSGDVDWVKFTISSAGSYIIGSSNSGVLMQLHKQSGGSNIPVGSAFAASKTISLDAGTYFLKASSRYGSSVDSYVLSVRRDTTIYPDSFENDNSQGGAKTLSIGAAQTHTLHTTSDIDYMKFSASSGYRYSVNTTGANLVLSLINSSGSTVASASGINAKLDYSASNAGTYYVRVASAEGKEVESYSVSLSRSTVNLAENYAVLFDGGYTQESHGVRFYNDIKGIYEKLISLGIPANHIYVLAADGLDPANDRNDSYANGGNIKANSNMSYASNRGSTVLSATYSNLDSVMTRLGQIVDGNDHFFMYLSDHGGSGNYIDVNGDEVLASWNNTRISISQLNSQISKVSTAYATLLYSQCHSGGMLNSLSMSEGKLFGIASAAFREYSWELTDGSKGFAQDFLAAVDHYGSTMTTVQMGSYMDQNGFFSCHNTHSDNGVCAAHNVSYQSYINAPYTAQHTWYKGSNFQVFAQT